MINIKQNIKENSFEKLVVWQKAHILYTAKASLSETKYHLLLVRDLNYLKNDKYLELFNKANEVGKLINGLINYLKK